MIPIHPTSSRDHCNNCLTGLHVDIYPGDRANTCKGILTPKELEVKNGKTKIIYMCNKCRKIIKNVTSIDDSFEQLLNLSK